jgi:hypothetical protein
MGFYALATRSTDSTDLADGASAAHARYFFHLSIFLIHMRTGNRTLIISILSGLIVLCGCAVVFLLSSQIFRGGAQPTGGEPSDVEPTQSVALTAIVTAIAPEVNPQPAIPERRRLTLEFPPQIRAGDSDLVRLTLEVDDLGNLTPTAEIDDNVIEGKVVEIPNLYETHQVIAESRFDLAGMEVRPSDLVSEALLPGSTVTFRWSIRPQEVGVYRGTIWLYLRFVDKQTGEESRKTISAQLVEIESVNFLGLSGGFARTAGVIGSVLGTVIGFPFFEDILKLVLKRRIMTK